MDTWRKKKEYKHASLRQILHEDSARTENFDISLSREAETFWAFVFSVGKKLQLLHAACCFLYNHEKYPIKNIIKLPISQIIIISVDLWDSSLPWSS